MSFAAVAISLTHTVKTLEPAFNVVMSQLFMGKRHLRSFRTHAEPGILWWSSGPLASAAAYRTHESPIVLIMDVPPPAPSGTSTPLPVIASLIPIMVGVSLASASELSFNWLGFNTAMLSNLTFGVRAVFSKKAMQTIKNLDSTAIYAYTTLISMLICVPLALIIEGPHLMAGMHAAIAKVGATTFYSSLAMVGLWYHLYNQASRGVTCFVLFCSVGLGCWGVCRLGCAGLCLKLLAAPLGPRHCPRPHWLRPHATRYFSSP